MNEDQLGSGYLLVGPDSSVTIGGVQDFDTLSVVSGPTLNFGKGLQVGAECVTQKDEEARTLKVACDSNAQALIAQPQSMDDVYPKRTDQTMSMFNRDGQIYTAFVISKNIADCGTYFVAPGNSMTVGAAGLLDLMESQGKDPCVVIVGSPNSATVINKGKDEDVVISVTHLGEDQPVARTAAGFTGIRTKGNSADVIVIERGGEDAEEE